MPESYDPINHAQKVIQRGRQIVIRLPANHARLLWRRVILIQESTADPAVGIYLACAGAQVSLYTPDVPIWDEQYEGRLFPAMFDQLVQQDNRFELNILQNLNQNNYHSTFRFSITQADFAILRKSAEIETEPCDTILVEGISQLLTDPRSVLTVLHELCLPGGLIEIISCPGDQCTEAGVAKVKRAAVEMGFGIRHFSHSLNTTDDSYGLGFMMGLICLSTPMTDFPVVGRENTQIMAQCHARLDIACKLVSGKTVLDAGGGTGIGARRYLKAGAQNVVCLEVNNEAIKIGRELSKELNPEKLKFVHWDLNAVPLPFEDNSFDVVVCLEVLEHINKQLEAIQEYYRILRPGGVLLVSVPDNQFEEESSHINQHENPFHLYVPSRDEFSSMLKNFEDIRWIRQHDVTASMVYEENYNGVWKGNFTNLTDWNPHGGKAQVIAVVCVKPELVDGSNSLSTDPNKTKGITAQNFTKVRKKKNKKKLPVKLLSAMHPWGDNSQILLQLRLRYMELEHRILTDRYEWWCKCNRLQADCSVIQLLLEEMNLQVSEAETYKQLAITDKEKASREFDYKTDQLINQRDVLQGEYDKLKNEISVITSEYQQKSEKWDIERSSLNDSIQMTLDQLEKSRSQLDDSRNELNKMSGKLKLVQLDNNDKQHLLIKVNDLNLILSREREIFEKERAAWREESKNQQEIIQDTFKQNEIKRSQILHVQNKLNQTKMQLDRVLSESQQNIRKLQSQLSEVTLQLHNHEIEAEDNRKNWQQEKMRLINERELLIQQLSENVNTAVDRIERRCLDIESRVYDVEDELDVKVPLSTSNVAPASATAPVSDNGGCT